MTEWIISGLRSGIKTTKYPKNYEEAPGVTPGRPIGDKRSIEDAAAIVDCCPVQAISQNEGKVSIDYRKCIHCYRCLRGSQHPLKWEDSYEWASLNKEIKPLNGPFQKAVNIIVVDAGDCGACLNEVKQLSNPYYNIHRLGFFITPTPRHADILLVVGCVTDHMHIALSKVYNAMPQPNRVIAVGACALSGGIFHDSFVCSKRLSDIMPVDVEVPGDPPPPLSILHGLLVAVGRKPPFKNSSD